MVKRNNQTIYGYSISHKAIHNSSAPFQWLPDDRSISIPPSQPMEDWLSLISCSDPLYEECRKHRITSEESYLMQEGALPSALNHALGEFRFHALTGAPLAKENFLGDAHPLPIWFTELSIDQIDFGLRIKNALLISRITNIGDLVNLNEAEIARLPHVGVKSLPTIVEKLYAALKKGPYSLEEELSEERRIESAILYAHLKTTPMGTLSLVSKINPLWPKTLPEGEMKSRIIASGIMSEAEYQSQEAQLSKGDQVDFGLARYTVLTGDQTPSEKTLLRNCWALPPALLNRSLRSLHLHQRTLNLLKRVKSLAQIAEKSEKEWRNHPGLGPQNFGQLRQQLYSAFVIWREQPALLATAASA